MTKRYATLDAMLVFASAVDQLEITVLGRLWKRQLQLHPNFTVALQPVWFGEL